MAIRDPADSGALTDFPHSVDMHTWTNHSLCRIGAAGRHVSSATALVQINALWVSLAPLAVVVCPALIGRVIRPLRLPWVSKPAAVARSSGGACRHAGDSPQLWGRRGHPVARG